MAVQTQIPVTMVENQQQAGATQPVGENYPAAMHRMHLRALPGTDQQTIPLEPGVGAPLAAEAGPDGAADRQRQFALGLGEGQAARRGRDAGDSLIEFLDQRCQLGPLALAPTDLLLLRLAALTQPGEHPATLFALGFQLALARRQGLPVLLQGSLLADNLRTGFADLLDGVTVTFDLVHPRAADIAVITQHAGDPRRIILVEHHLQIILPPRHIGRTNLAGDLVLLGLQCHLQRLGLLSQILQAAFTFANLLFQLAAFPAQPTDFALAVLQLLFQTGGFLPDRAEQLLQPGNFLLGLLQLGPGLFCIRRLRRGRQCRQQHQAQQHSRP